MCVCVQCQCMYIITLFYCRSKTMPDTNVVVDFSIGFYVRASGWAHASVNTCRSSNHINIMLNCSRAARLGDFPISLFFSSFVHFFFFFYSPVFVTFFRNPSIAFSNIDFQFFPIISSFLFFKLPLCFHSHDVNIDTCVCSLFFFCVYCRHQFCVFIFVYHSFMCPVCICSISLSYVIQFKLCTVWYLCFHFSILHLVHLLPNTFSSFRRKLRR